MLISAEPNTESNRLAAIEQRRRSMLYERQSVASAKTAASDWIHRSWMRCLALGQAPDEDPCFQLSSRQHEQRVKDQNNELISTAEPVLKRLADVIASTKYFTVLTDSSGIVLDAKGAIDYSDKRANQIVRVGTDLSESAIGTSAIGTCLVEKRSVWLHRGEHFLSGNRIYSCAGVPVFKSLDECVGMLDLTGIDVPERRELTHLAARASKEIQKAYLRSMCSAGKHARLIQLQWPNSSFDGSNDGLLAVDESGTIIAANQAVKEWLPELALTSTARCEDYFSVGCFDTFIDAMSRGRVANLALWSGLQVAARWYQEPVSASDAPLKVVEAEMIRKAINKARGNVAQAAGALGISRATLYRKLHKH